jgi:hypothetical protein
LTRLMHPLRFSEFQGGSGGGSPIHKEN